MIWMFLHAHASEQDHAVYFRCFLPAAQPKHPGLSAASTRALDATKRNVENPPRNNPPLDGGVHDIRLEVRPCVTCSIRLKCASWRRGPRSCSSVSDMLV